MGTNKKRLIYLACPYSDPDPAVRQARFEAANRAVAIMIRAGHLVFSPITHSHSIALQCNLPGDFSYWGTWNLRMLDACDELWILKLPGWQESEGIKAEREHAERTGKPVREFEP